MLSEIRKFVKWVHHRNPESRIWRNYGYELNIFVSVVRGKCRGIFMDEPQKYPDNYSNPR